jgi:UDP-arabinose 4-epimerase
LNTIFVIGGAGYVGSHCCKRFASAGWRVVTFDNLSTGWREFVKWGPLIEGDILDRAGLNAAVRATQPDVVAHFAALSSVADSMADPGRYYRNNVQGSLNVLDALRAAETDKLVFSSSAAIYGMPAAGPVTEAHPLAPINPYGATKLMAERMMADYGAAHGLRWVALRYFNAAGADPEGRIGERHHPETHLIPLAMRSLLGDDQVFTVCGGDYDTRDGAAIRDYVHVDDLASAHLAAADYLLAGGPPVALNLGTGRGASVLEVADTIERASGRILQRRIGPRRLGDPPMLVASNTLARERLDWTPKYDLDEIVRTAWRWHGQDASA